MLPILTGREIEDFSGFGAEGLGFGVRDWGFR